MAKKKTALPGMFPQSYRPPKRGESVDSSQTLRYELLARWAAEQWEQQYPDRGYLVLWASENCGNNLARTRVKTGRKLKGKARFMGYDQIACPHVMPISDYRLPGRHAVIAETVGAFSFHFKNDSEAF